MDSTNFFLYFSFLSSQGLLGGFALLNLLMTYMLSASSLPEGGFLGYYAPIARPCGRIYITLTTLSLLGAVDKYSKDKLVDFMPRGLSQFVLDVVLIVLYVLAFILSMVVIPFEDLLFYSYKRVPNWWNFEPRNNGFSDRYVFLPYLPI